MATDDRVKVLEDEFKLIKSELRQTLSSVRDFLMDLKLPPMHDDPEAIKKLMQPQAASVPSSSSSSSSSSGSQGQGMNSQPQYEQPMPMEMNMDVETPEPAPEPEIATEPENTMEPESNYEEVSEKVTDTGSDELLDFNPEDTGISSGDLPGEKKPEFTSQESEGVNVMRAGESGSRTPQVNMLANLVRWVSRAKREIGLSQLPVFLEVYGASGNLADEMKEMILHLAEAATDPAHEHGNTDGSHLLNEEMAMCLEISSLAGQLPEELRTKIRHLTELIMKQMMYADKADIWSQMLLELHGILTGGGSPSQLLQPYKKPEVEEIEEDENAEEESRMELDETDGEETKEPKGTRPARLRLVMPVGDGSEQELDLGNLFISTESKSKNGNGHTKLISSKR